MDFEDIASVLHANKGIVLLKKKSQQDSSSHHITVMTTVQVMILTAICERVCHGYPASQVTSLKKKT